MKTLFKLISSAAIALAISGHALAVDINAGPIWNNDDAKSKCPAVCSGSGMKWNGNWKTKVQNEMSVCGCDQAASNTPSAQVPSATANNTQNPEDACFNAVQGKVAWDQNGNKQWKPDNIKNLCRGVKSDFTPRIQCFSNMITKGSDWTKAIPECVAKG